MTTIRSRKSHPMPITLLIMAVMLLLGTLIPLSSPKPATAQSVSWLSNDSIGYLSSAGIPVMVPSWIPDPVSGSSPEIYAGGGSYSIYFYSGSSFLFITGVAGAGFPGGSEANLNVELSVNTSVQGWSAIRDIGVPEGASTPIYDKVMWIANGVLYTVSSNGIDGDSLSLANSSVQVYQQAPKPEPTAVPQSNTGSTGTNTSGASSSNTVTTPQGVDDLLSDDDVTPQATSDGTDGPWYTGQGVNDYPSDGTSGPTAPFFDVDGTGGAW